MNQLKGSKFIENLNFSIVFFLGICACIVYISTAPQVSQNVIVVVYHGVPQLKFANYQYSSFGQTSEGIRECGTDVAPSSLDCLKEFIHTVYVTVHSYLIVAV